MKTNPLIAVCAALFVMAIAVQNVAYAQQGQLEEIMVTAEKREQSLQDVPASVYAFSESYIEDARIDNANQLIAHVPGMHLASFTRIQSLPSIRGAHSGEDGPGLDQPVIMFVDDVFKGRVTDWDLALFDVERIEVLRGPQGTLFGRNAVGGVINVVTKKPTEDTRAVVQAGTGNFNLIDVKGVVSAPMSEDVFGSVAFSSQTREGFMRNPTTGNKIDSIDKQSAKVQLRFVPSDDRETLWQTEFLRDTGFGFHRDYLGATPSSPEFNGYVPDSNPDTSHNSNDGGVDRTAFGTSLVIDRKTDFGQFKSISAYFEDDAKLAPTDVFGSPLKDLFVEYQWYEVDQFSQEFRLSGEDSLDGKLDWVIGAYYLTIDHTRDRTFGLDLPLGTYLGDIFPGADAPQMFTALMNVKSDSISAFAQGTYSLSDRFRLTLGGRYTSDDKEGLNTQYGDVFIFSVGDFSLPFQDSWSKFTPRVTFEADFGEDVMAYVSYSEGFKSGGFIHWGLDTAEDHLVPLNQETAKNMEIGLRSVLMDNRVSLNLTAYSVEYTDLQVSQLVGTVMVQTNAGKAEADGIDLEINAALTENLTAWLNYSYFDGTYTGIQFTGNEMVTPPKAYTAGMSYVKALSDGGEMRFRLDVQHKDEYFQDPANEPGIVNDLDSIINASITYAMNSQWEFSLWVKNLRDERAMNYLNDTSPFMLSLDQMMNGEVTLAANYIPPMTWGLSARFSFE